MRELFHIFSKIIIETSIVNDYGIHVVNYSTHITKEQGLILAEAVLKDQGYGWNKYPQTKPESTGWYLVSVCTGMGTAIFYAYYDENGGWSDHHGAYTKDPDAWCKPRPYQPKETE